jgi:hypothetical protein
VIAGLAELSSGDIYCETGPATTLQSMRSAVASPAAAASKPIPKRRSKRHDAVHSVRGNFMEVLIVGLHVGLLGTLQASGRVGLRLRRVLRLRKKSENTRSENDRRYRAPHEDPTEQFHISELCIVSAAISRGLSRRLRSLRGFECNRNGSHFNFRAHFCLNRRPCRICLDL